MAPVATQLFNCRVWNSTRDGSGTIIYGSCFFAYAFTRSSTFETNSLIAGSYELLNWHETRRHGNVCLGYHFLLRLRVAGSPERT